MDYFYSKIKYEVDTQGFSVLEPIKETVDIAENICRRYDSKFIKSQNDGYKVNIFKQEILNQPENSDILKYHEFCKNIIPSLTNDSLYLDSIFQTYDTPSSSHIAQAPHFDRIPTLKFMLYANDLVNKNGAFRLSPGSHHWVYKRLGKNRLQHGAKGFLELTREIPTYIKEKLISIEGKQGTIIIFNTDCIHHQGLVSEESAMIIRAHYRVKTFKNPFLRRLSAVVSKIGSN